MSEKDPNRNSNILLLPWMTAAVICSFIAVVRNPEQFRTLTTLLGIAVAREGGGGGPPSGSGSGGGNNVIENFFADDGEPLAFDIPPAFLLLGAAAIAFFALLSSRSRSYAAV